MPAGIAVTLSANVKDVSGHPENGAPVNELVDDETPVEQLVAFQTTVFRFEHNANAYVPSEVRVVGIVILVNATHL